jgi:hypothetical protein
VQRLRATEPNSASERIRYDFVLFRLNEQNPSSARLAAPGTAGLGVFDAEVTAAAAEIVRTVELGTPGGVTTAGEKLHAAPAGRPEQLSSTGAENPSSGMISTFVALVWPRATVNEFVATFNANFGELPPIV